MNKKLLTFFGITLLIILAVSAGRPIEAQVGTGIFGFLNGYAWSAFKDATITGAVPGGVGWISFSSSAGGSIPYRVEILPSGSTGGTANGLKGRAWSSNYGWLSFDRSVTGAPPRDDIYASANLLAKMETVDGTKKIFGWARFLNGCEGDLWNGGACTGPGAGTANGITAPGSAGDFWDGWVSLSPKSGDTQDYGLKINNNNRVYGYAWGGSNNVGWIWFGDNEPCRVGSSIPCINIPPDGNTFVASCEANLSAPGVGESVTWTGRADNGVAPYNYIWTGNAVANGTDTTSNNTVTKTNSYTEPGPKTAYLRVTDSTGTVANNGQNASCSVIVGGGGGVCQTPSNARPRTNSNGTSNNIGVPSTTLNEYLRIFGGWADTDFVDVDGKPRSCQFECSNANYVIRNGQCTLGTIITEE